MYMDAAGKHSRNILQPCRFNFHKNFKSQNKIKGTASQDSMGSIDGIKYYCIFQLVR